MAIAPIRRPRADAQDSRNDRGSPPSNTTAWTTRYDRGADLLVPLKSGEGRYVASETVLDELEGEGRVVFRYRDNANGSMRGIAGISARMNVGCSAR